MLPFDILAADNHVHSFEPACLLRRSQRFPKGAPQNAWEHALMHVQENDAPTLLPAIVRDPGHAMVLRYCAVHVLLAKRAHLLNAERIEDWYLLLDGWLSPLLPQRTLGQWRTAYGIEWLHARAMQATPMQSIWFAGDYWPTRWSATSLHSETNPSVVGHSIERWSFLGPRWHIQHWLCENSDDDTWETVYTSRIASPVCVRNALARTLLLNDQMRLAAWQSIPQPLRAPSLLDWALRTPDNEHCVLPYLCETLGTDMADLSARVDLARTIDAPASTILDSLAQQTTAWSLPDDDD